MKSLKIIFALLIFVVLIMFAVLVVGYKKTDMPSDDFITEISVISQDEFDSDILTPPNFIGSVSLDEKTILPMKQTFTAKRYYSSYDPDVREVTSSFIAKIVPNGEDYYIEENPGPSGDPHLQYFRKEKEEYVYKGSTATKIVIPGNGFIYSSGTQNPFGDYSKYKLNAKGEIVEVIQPYYYSGVDSVAQKNFSIKNNEGEVVAEISVGSPATIVLVEYPKSGFPMDIRFLIKTQHNILGWYQSNDIPSCFNSHEAVIKEMCWGGD